jgi:hypothetical protein
MTMTDQEREVFDELEVRIRAILPTEYQDNYEDVQPVSMGSAGLKYGRDGKVAWDEIWGTFCDLAMAGGPPHKGKLLEPGAPTDTEAYREVVKEICRGIDLVADLPAKTAPTPGWVRVTCESVGMAGWMARAIAMENVSARCEGKYLDLPAGPDYRVEKEIKNVITAIAKTGHYWLDHMWASQQKFIGNLFLEMAAESPLVQPALVESEALAAAIAEKTGMRRSVHRYAGWVGLECSSVKLAIWMMRALVASNVFSRREDMVLFVAVNAAVDPDGEIVARAVRRVRGFAVEQRIV